MSKAHVFFQFKGGVGKSTLAAMFAEHKMERGVDIVALDADPMNQSLAAYEGLNVQIVNLLEDKTVSKHKVDDLMDSMFEIAEERADVEFIIDVGASSYPVISKYFEVNAVFDVLEEEGITPIVHCPMVGSDMYYDTAAGLASVIKRFPQTKIVLWLNSFFGEVCDVSRVPFEGTVLYEQCKKNIMGVVHIPQIDKEDIGIKTSNRLLFSDCSDEHFKRMALRRINAHWNKITTDIEQTGA